MARSGEELLSNEDCWSSCHTSGNNILVITGFLMPVVLSDAGHIQFLRGSSNYEK